MAEMIVAQLDDGTTFAYEYDPEISGPIKLPLIELDQVAARQWWIDNVGDIIPENLRNPGDAGDDVGVVLIDPSFLNGGGDPGTPAGGDLVTDNAQDTTNFDIQIRNATGGDLEWVMVWRDRPYADLTGLSAGPYTHSVAPSGALFDHTFTGNAPLAGFANVVITADLPAPVGDSDASAVERFIV